MKEQWIDDLRRRMSQRQAVPPPRLWESIVSAVGKKGEKVRK